MFLRQHRIVLCVVALGCVTILLGSNRYGFTLTDNRWTNTETSRVLVQQHSLQWQRKMTEEIESEAVDTYFDQLPRVEYSTVTATIDSDNSVRPRQSNHSLEELQVSDLKPTSMQEVQEKEEHDMESVKILTNSSIMYSQILTNKHKVIATTERATVSNVGVIILPRQSAKHSPRGTSDESVMILRSVPYQQPREHGTNTTEFPDEGTNALHRPSQSPVPNTSSNLSTTMISRATEAVPVDHTESSSQSEHREKLQKMLKTLFPSQLRKYGKKLPPKSTTRFQPKASTTNDSRPTQILTPTLQSILALTVNLKTSQNDTTDTQTQLPDVFFSVKATKSFHSTRLSLLLVTWMQNVRPQQVHIVTDTYDDEWTQTAKQMGFNVIHSRCQHEHSVVGLCCKTSREFEQYYAAVEIGGVFQWYCHFDDDTYVNIPALSKTLKRYQPDVEPLYIGHFPSVRKELGKVSPSYLNKFFPKYKGNRQFYFATGAAYCLSSTLMREMTEYLRHFEVVCKRRLSLPDDMAVAALVCTVLGHKLTEIPEMLSHLEPVGLIPQEFLRDMVTVGFKGTKTVKIMNGRFTIEEDPSRFLSYHCLLHPETKWCRGPLTT